MIKIHIIRIIAILLFPFFLYANQYCQKCGMNLHHHKETNHKIIIENQEITLCSLHCAIDAIKDNNKYEIKGFNNTTQSFIPIGELIYIIGSNKKGAMTKESEFAFSSSDDVKAFIQENGGRIINGTEIIKYAKSKFDSDQKMIKTNQAKIIKLGKNIVNEYCNNANRIRANNIADLKLELKKYCKNIDEAGLQAAALYLWND